MFASITMTPAITRHSNMKASKAETLGAKQRRFTLAVAHLVSYAYSRGYELTYGDAYRSELVFGKFGESKGYGKPYSTHKLRLAVDFNLFKDGKWLQDTASHQFLGEYWESIGGTWGGRFGDRDGNHYSFEYNGYK